MKEGMKFAALIATVIMAAMGHATADTTADYLDRDREAAARVAEAVG